MRYLAEHAYQPERFSSIPATMWWSAATLPTLGYGDIYPVTATGKFLGSLIAIVGIALFALPAGIITPGLMEVRESPQPTHCPHCGKSLAEHGDRTRKP